MLLQKHIIDTIKEWQMKIGYRDGSMKLYYPGETLELLLADKATDSCAEACCLRKRLSMFCQEQEPVLGRIQITGDYERYCLDIPAKGCEYVARNVPEPEFLKQFLQVITEHGSSMDRIRSCFVQYAEKHVTDYIEEVLEEHVQHGGEHTHQAYAFLFADDAVEEYVYWVEENEFGITYHRFTKEEYARLK